MLGQLRDCPVGEHSGDGAGVAVGGVPPAAQRPFDGDALEAELLVAHHLDPLVGVRVVVAVGVELERPVVQLGDGLIASG